MMRTNILIPMVLSAGVAVAEAGTYKWADSTSAAANWRDAAKWTDETGQPVAAAPWNDASQTAQFGPMVSSLTNQVIDVDARDTSAGGWTWAEVAMPAISETGSFASRRTMQVLASATTGVGEYGSWLTLQDVLAPDFLWTFAHGGFGFRLPSTADRTLALSHVSAAKRVTVSVPTAGTKATLETVHEGGPLAKQGAGELEVKVTTGSDTFFHVADGTLTLDGQGTPDAGDDVPVPGAWMHLDANRLDTLKTYAGDDGRTYVTNWADVRGNGVYAYHNAAWRPQPSQTYLVDKLHAPFINTNLVVGKRVMDFGRSDNGQQSEDLGPANCALDFCQVRTGVREVFMAFGVSHWKNGVELFKVPVFSDASDYPFLPTRNKIVENAYAMTHAAAYGDILVDGVRRSNAADMPMTFGVVSIGLTNAVKISMMSTDRRYKENTGGLRIGEVLVYTNVLTHAQRLAVHRYLQRKWTLRGSVEGSDAGAVTLASNSAAISVPAGRTAQIGEVTAIGGTLVKTGEGELRVGSVVGKMGADKVSVDVRGGSVSFGGLEAAPTDKPADGAYLWLDANKASSFVYDDSSAATVSEWHDCRDTQTAVFAQKPVGCYDYVAGGKLPVRVTNAKGTMSAVDFGDFSKSNETSAFMKLDSVYTARIYDAFIVQAYTSSGSTVGNVFGSSSGVSLMKTSATALLASTYGLYQGRSAYWTVNGAVADPVADGEVAFQSGDFNVVSVSSPYKLYIDLLGAKDRLGQGSKWGGVQIGEFIIYDRPLTPAERRQTIAYLMKRWQGKSPAYAAGATAQVGSLTFPASQAATVDTDTDLAVRSIEGSNGALVKTGSGTLSVAESLYDKAPASISVEDGRLEMTGGSPLAGILAKTEFHFDASDRESLSYSVTETGDGPVTNVTSVADQRVAGLAANSWKNPTQVSPNPISFADPTLRTVETAPGVFRPVLDFGDENVHDAYARWPTNFNAAGMRFSKTFDDVREVYTLFADSDKDNRNGATIFADDSNYHFMRGGSSQLVSANYPQSKIGAAAQWTVDGASVAYNSALPSGLHLVSAALTNNASVGAIALDRNCVAGGCQVGELLGFNAALTEVERIFLLNHLMVKWLGAAELRWTNAVATASVSSGATLAFGDSDVIRFSALGGEGSVKAAAVLANGSLSLTPGKPLTVVGRFGQEGPLTVGLGTIDRKIPAGEYPVLRADGYDGLSLVTWSISSPLPGNRDFSFVLKDGVVCLCVKKHGMAIIVR